MPKSSAAEPQQNKEAEKTRQKLGLVEAALYVAGKPLDLNELCSVLGTRSKKKAKKLADALMQEYVARNTALEILELKEELAFYRGIVSPKDAASGLHLQSFKIESSGRAQGYRYKVILTQVLQNDRLARGIVKIKVDGLQGQTPKTLNLSDITANSVKDLEYRFKYFQNLEGDLLLPKGFSPLRVTISVLPNGRDGEETIEKTYDWPA